jgi:hypothetical protein
MTLSQLNWRQGFFRFWIIGSVLFVIAVAAISYSKIEAQFEAVAFKKLTERDVMLVPVLCGEAQLNWRRVFFARGS